MMDIHYRVEEFLGPPTSASYKEWRRYSVDNTTGLWIAKNPGPDAPADIQIDSDGHWILLTTKQFVSALEGCSSGEDLKVFLHAEIAIYLAIYQQP